ncbi:DUF3105 domain-containing protein [Micromonospora sp. NPDC047707]|uniref:DUF3105 domain-containing protein n=1 Tax=Micromonospora sp. NPDC047707 TaxID=3154498 RepID=UPI003456D024
MSERGRRWLWRCGLGLTLCATLAALLVGPWRTLVGTVAGSPPGDALHSCPAGTAFPIMDSPHVSQSEMEQVRYNSQPPTSGPHFAFSLAPGRYTVAVPEGLAVHAMEHGHVIILYAETTPETTIADLERVAKRHADKVVLAPSEKLSDGIAMTAWGCLETLSGYDESAVERFVVTLGGRYDHGWRR